MNNGDKNLVQGKSMLDERSKPLEMGNFQIFEY